MKLGIDIGGTFTDFVLYDEHKGGLFFFKSLTTYPDPTNGIFNGIEAMEEKYGLDIGQIETIVHGTTLVTNAVIERKGAKTAFVATKGFEDVLEIGRELRYDIYDLFLTMPKPLVARNWRMGITERVSTTGDVITPIQKDELSGISKLIEKEGIESVGVCLLNSFANKEHETIIGQYIKEHHPSVSVSLSSEIMPEIREYERSSATAMNAYVQPLTDEYLARLKDRLIEKKFGGQLLIMISNGSLTNLEGAIKIPIHLLESGPAGGSMAGVHFGEKLGYDNLLCFDMGGTTAKASLIHEGNPEITHHFEAGRVKRFKKGSGLPVRIPVIDMIEIGAGGGSIARVNHLGLLTVGPDSASSTPGPACYNLGGEDPTVTDADLVLGYLNESYFLGGTMQLSRARAIEAIRKKIAQPLGISVEEAAMGVHRIVNENMANAARVHILEKGMDPRHFNMMAFGGAGPVHAFGVAKLLNAPKMIIPVGAGVASALGFLVSPVAYERIHSHINLVEELDWDEVNHFLQDMTKEGTEFLQKIDSSEAYTVHRILDIRYEGQGHEITIDLPKGILSDLDREELQRRFEKEYEFRYGRTISDVPIEAVTWRVQVKGPVPAVQVVQKSDNSVTGEAFKGKRKVYFQETGYLDCPVYNRYALRPNEEINGPAIVEEKESTLVIGINASFYLDELKNIVITMPE